MTFGLQYGMHCIVEYVHALPNIFDDIVVYQESSSMSAKKIFYPSSGRSGLWSLLQISQRWRVGNNFAIQSKDCGPSLSIKWQL